MTPEDLPRLTDAEVDSLDGYVAIEGVPEGGPASHTPGPWFVADDRCTVYVRRSGGDEPGICATDGSVIAPISSRGEQQANALLISAAPDMKAALDDLEDSFDKEIYPEQKREDFDAPDDRTYSVTITAKQWRALGRALGKANGERP